MKDIRTLLNDLAEFVPRLVALNEKIVENLLSQVYLVDKDSDFSENAIFITHESTLKGKLETIRNATLFIIKDSYDLMLPLEHENNIILFSENINPFKLYQKTQDCLRYDRKLANDALSLLKILIGNSTTGEILNQCAVLLNHPLLIMDTSFRIISYSANITTEDPYWNKIVSRGYCTYEEISNLNHLMKQSDAITTNKPYLAIVEGSLRRRLMSKIISGTHHMGFLICLGDDDIDTFSNINWDLFAMMSDLFAKLILQESSKNHLHETTDNILVDCLEGKIKDKSAFYDRLKLTKFDLTSAYHILIIDIDDYFGLLQHSGFLKNTISSFFKYSWSVSFLGNVVVLVDTKKIENIGKSLESKRSFFLENHLKIAVSEKFTDLYDIKKHYQLVKSALYISKRLNDQAVIIHYEDYKFYNLVLSTEDRTRIPFFVSSVFYQVLQYDLDNSTEYCDTIFAYIACDKKLEETASKLSVHRNTVSYRIKKAKELFDLDFTQVSQQFRFYYSYMISKMCKSNIL